MVQHDFLHMSFFKDDFKEFVDTLVVALRSVEQADSPVRHIHPVVLRDRAGAPPGLESSDGGL